MSLARVVCGPQEHPMRLVLYGVEGVGKSTFASQAPSPIFLCPEDGTSRLDLVRFPKPERWADVFDALAELRDEPHEFRTLVIDPIDRLEPLCWQHLCRRHGMPDIDAFGYGKGHTLALELWRELLEQLDELSRDRRLHVILVGHAVVRRADDPHQGGYDRYRLRAHERTGELWREWADCVLFARHEVLVAGEAKGKTRARSTGGRVLHTEWDAAFDAKNRFGLPPQLPLCWADFEQAARRERPASLEALRRELRTWLSQLHDPDERTFVQGALSWAGDHPLRLAQLLDRVRTKVQLAMCEEEAVDLTTPP